MRFKLILEVNKRVFGGMLPINYQYEQSAAIYKILSGADEAYASWLHDNGFRLESGKTFKLFIYSRFKIENFRIFRDTERLQILLSGRSVSCPKKALRNSFKAFFKIRCSR